MSTLDYLLLPLSLTFMQHAFTVTLMIAVPMAAISCFLVLKGWSLMGDAVSHAVLPGIVTAYLVGLPLAVGAFVAGLICAVLSGYLKENSRIKEDTVLGIVFSGMFGIGLVIFVWARPDVHLDHILFGDMLGISRLDILETGLIALASGLFVFGRRRDLLVHAFDPQHARAIGLPVRVLHYGLLIVLSLTVVGALKAVGIILSVALLIAPGTIAFLLTRRFDAMLATAVALALGCSFLGIYISFFLDSAPAPTIVLLMSIAFVAAFLNRMRADRKADRQADQQADQTAAI